MFSLQTVRTVSNSVIIFASAIKRHLENARKGKTSVLTHVFAFWIFLPDGPHFLSLCPLCLDSSRLPFFPGRAGLLGTRPPASLAGERLATPQSQHLKGAPSLPVTSAGLHDYLPCLQGEIHYDFNGISPILAFHSFSGPFWDFVFVLCFQKINYEVSWLFFFFFCIYIV